MGMETGSSQANTPRPASRLDGAVAPMADIYAGFDNHVHRLDSIANRMLGCEPPRVEKEPEGSRLAVHDIEVDSLEVKLQLMTSRFGEVLDRLHYVVDRLDEL